MTDMPELFGYTAFHHSFFQLHVTLKFCVHEICSILLHAHTFKDLDVPLQKVTTFWHMIKGMGDVKYKIIEELE